MNTVMSKSPIKLLFQNYPIPDGLEISDWTKAHLDWLQSLDICPNRAPSHDTYERFFRYLDATNPFGEFFT